MAADWSVRPSVVWYLVNPAGVVIVDENGQPKGFASPDEALHVAANWDRFRMPTLSEVEGMTADEIGARIAGDA